MAYPAAFLTSLFCTMSFLSSSLRTAAVLVVLGLAPARAAVAGATHPAPAPLAWASQEPAAPAAAPAEVVPQLALRIGPVQLRLRRGPGRPSLFERLLFSPRVATLARQLVLGEGIPLPF